MNDYTELRAALDAESSKKAGQFALSPMLNPAIRALLDERDALARDAERYRWLRDLPLGSPHEDIGNMPGDMWDAAIDAARKEG